jgi:hypothetical protein
VNKKKDKNDSVNSSGSGRNFVVRSKKSRGGSETTGERGEVREALVGEIPSDSEHRQVADTGFGKAGLKPKQLRWTFERAVRVRDGWFEQGEHWFLANRAVTGEERLWWSVLSQALHDYLKPNGVRAVKWWLLSEREDEGSFLWICDHLRIHSGNLRQKVMAIKEPINFNVGLSTTWGLFNSDRTPLPKKFRGGRGKK